MDLELAAQMWDTLKPWLHNDADSAAEDVVQLLVELGVELEDIKSAFGDRDITNAVKSFDDSELIEDEEDPYDDEYYDEDDEY